MGEAAYNSIFMGDVVLGTSASVTLTFDTGIPLPTTITVGDMWFASPVQLVAHVLYEYNLVSGSTLGYSLDVDPESSNFGKLNFTGLSATMYIDATADVEKALGFTGTINHSNKLPSRIDAFFGPVWPIPVYKRSVVGGGVRDRAEGGGIVSFAGMYQEKRTLSVQLDRRGDDFTEWEEWKDIWEQRWRQGRAVTLYLRADLIPSGMPQLADSTSVGSADVLVIDAAKEYMATMLIPAKQFVDIQQETAFYVKMPEPYSDEGWGQGKIQY